MDKFFEKMKNSFIMQIIFFAVSIAVIIGVYILGFDRIEHNKVLGGEIVTDIAVSNDIEGIVYENDRIIMNGWILRQYSLNKNIQVLLRAEEGAASFLLDTEMETNEHIMRYFSEDWDYGNIAFETKINRNKLKDGVCYQIILVLTYEDGLEATEVKSEITKHIATGKYIYNASLYDYNPEEFIKLSFQDDLMQNVVNDGEVCLYDVTKTIYVYRYEDDFYWIVGENFDFDNEGKTYISYQLGTSMPELLPEKRQIYEFENWDFYFEEKEYILEEETSYRVAINMTPKDFPVTYYLTALYDLENRQFLWKGYMHPAYNLNNDN